MNKEVLRLEAAQYRELAAQIKQSYADIDDETLHDTLEGLSNLPDIIESIVRSSLEDDVLIVGLKSRIEDMSARLTRFRLRYDKKRELVAWAMGSTAIEKLEVSDFAVWLRQGAPRLDVTDESRLPASFLVPQPPKVDRTALTLALKAGQIVPGAALGTGAAHIAVKTR
jgi:hypothetical protein